MRRLAPSRPRKPSPFEAELDRLIELRANGWITELEFRTDKAAIERAQAAAEAKR